MSKKDYILLAKEIKEAIAKKKDLNDFALSLSLSLRVDNCRFDDTKFLKACSIIN
jgi:hypothetical protein